MKIIKFSGFIAGCMYTKPRRSIVTVSGNYFLCKLHGSPAPYLRHAHYMGGVKHRKITLPSSSRRLLSREQLAVERYFKWIVVIQNVLLCSTEMGLTKFTHSTAVNTPQLYSMH